MIIDDTFIAPTGPDARFPEREMRVIEVMEFNGEPWVDAVPVRPLPTDRFWHSTYRLDENGRVIPI